METISLRTVTGLLVLAVALPFGSADAMPRKNKTEKENKENKQKKSSARKKESQVVETPAQKLFNQRINDAAWFLDATGTKSLLQPLYPLSGVDSQEGSNRDSDGNLIMSELPGLGGGFIAQHPNTADSYVGRKYKRWTPIEGTHLGLGSVPDANALFIVNRKTGQEMAGPAILGMTHPGSMMTEYSTLMKRYQKAFEALRKNNLEVTQSVASMLKNPKTPDLTFASLMNLLSPQVNSLTFPNEYTGLTLEKTNGEYKTGWIFPMLSPFWTKVDLKTGQEQAPTMQWANFFNVPEGKQLADLFKSGSKAWTDWFKTGQGNKWPTIPDWTSVVGDGAQKMKPVAWRQ